MIKTFFNGIMYKVEAPVVDRLSNFRADGEEYEVMENFAI